MRRRMLPSSRTEEPPAEPERVAALDKALEDGGDLWQFGTRTLKGFSDLKLDPERSVAVELLDRNIARAAEGRVPTSTAADASASPRASSLHGPPSARASAFGADTLKGFASGAPPAGFPASSSQTVAAKEAAVPAMVTMNPERMLDQQTDVGVKPMSERARRVMLKYGYGAGTDAPTETLPPKQAAAAASPRQVETQSPRCATSFAPPRSPRAPLHGSVTTYNQQAVQSLLSGVSPRARIPQPLSKPPEWKVRPRQAARREASKFYPQPSEQLRDLMFRLLLLLLFAR